MVIEYLVHVIFFSFIPGKSEWCDARLPQQVDFHLKQLERKIVPTDTTKMSLWTLNQDESFYQNRKRGSLSLILRNELG